MKKKRIVAVMLMLIFLFSMTETVYAEKTAAVCLVPQASGKIVFRADSAWLDVSNASEGYLTAGYNGDCPKVKLQITGVDGICYTYDLHDGSEAFPLSAGSGEYDVGIYKNIEGNRYSTILYKRIYVEITNLFGSCLYPNQYVNFAPNSLSVAVAQQLSAPAQSDLEVVANVYNYVRNHITYDYEKAASVGKGYIPNADMALVSGKGICLDYASAMAGMLRSQGIPTRMEVGYVDGVYHAWVNVYVKEAGWVNGLICFDGVNWTLMDPTFAATSDDMALQQFIGDGSGYQTRFIY